MKRQLHTGAKLCEDHFIPVRNNEDGCIRQKPSGGLWTSSYVKKSSDWLEWCKREQFGDTENVYYTVLTPKRSAKIITVDTLADFHQLLKRFGKRRHSSYPSAFTIAIDFEAMSEEYDAMHLTEEGQWNTRLTIPGLYGWDCESTVWFRWCFSSLQIVREPTFAPLQHS